MKSLISPRFGDPTGYELHESATPTCQQPHHVLIAVKAASVNGHDVIMASGKTKAVQTVKLPYRLGLDFAGVVLEKGSAVTEFDINDEVFGFAFHAGTIATHIIIDLALPCAIARIPAGLDFIQAASLPATGLTAELALKRADTFFQADGGLHGKRVFIPGALSGVGSIAVQLAKHGYNCNVATAVSTAKIPKIQSSLGEGVVDKVVDYTKDDILQVVGLRGVDFVLDTTGKAGDYLPLIKKGGLCMSIARLPPGSALKEADQNLNACIGQNVLDSLDAGFRTWAKARYGVIYMYQKTDPTSADLQTLCGRCDNKQIKPVVGATAALDNLSEIKLACDAMLKGKGGLGKFVVTMDGAT